MGYGDMGYLGKKLKLKGIEKFERKINGIRKRDLGLLKELNKFIY